MRGLALAIAGAVWLLLVGTAGAAPRIGTLSFAQCLDDAGTSVVATCTDAPALEDPRRVAVSPDGRDVFVIADNSEAVTRFSRNRATGRLVFAQCFQDDNVTAPSDTPACTKVPWLEGPRDVTLSPDGRSVYVVARNDNTLVRFNRDLRTGEISFVQCFADNDTPLPVGCSGVNGLGGAVSVAASADGRSVIVAADNDDALVNFNRSRQSGALSFRQCFDDAAGGGEASCPGVQRLDFPTDVAIAPGGGTVLMTANGSDAVLRFSRNRSTGGLAPAGCVDDDETGSPALCAPMNGLDGPSGIAIAPDGRSAYVSTDSDRAVVHLRLTAGGMSFGGCIDAAGGPEPGCTAQPALQYPDEPAVSPDGLSVYVAGVEDDAISAYRRNPRTGGLSFLQCLDNKATGAIAQCPGVDGLNGPEAPTLSPDGRSLYVVGSHLDHSLALFNRTGLRCSGRRATHVGTILPDRIIGTGRADVIVTQGGRDRVFGRGGPDRICAGAGPDVARGGAGQDRLLGQRGFDRLFGESGRDVLLGGTGRDLLVGGPRRDRCVGGPGRDRLRSC